MLLSASAGDSGKLIVATALVSSLFTAVITEPVKVWVQGLLRRREIRRALISEITSNCAALESIVGFAEHDQDLIGAIGHNFCRRYKRISYDLAMTQPATLYSLRYFELYWIDTFYKDFEQVAHAEFNDDQTRLRNARYIAGTILTRIKNRDIDGRLVFRASPPWFKKHLRNRLPLESYIDVQPPPAMERLRRRMDAIVYRRWKTLGQKDIKP